MQLTFVARHIELTPTMKDFATEKFQALKKRHNNISNVSVTLHIEHLVHTAEANVHVYGKDFHAVAEEDDMYKAIESLADKLLAQITKHKEKMIEKHRE